jgi:hypothetical protein
VAAALRQRDALDRALGESLTEPKSTVWFERQPVPRQLRAVEIGVLQLAAITGVPLLATADGFAKTDAAAEGFLGQLPAAYFVPQPTAPKGYTVVSEATPDGDDVYITVTVTWWFCREATKIAIPVTGQEV